MGSTTDAGDTHTLNAMEDIMIEKDTLIHLNGTRSTYYKIIKTVGNEFKPWKYKDNAAMIEALVELGYAEQIRVFEFYATDNASFVWLEFQGYND